VREAVWVSRFVGHEPGTVDNGQHVDLIGFDAVDDPVRVFDQLADIFGRIFGDPAAGTTAYP